MVAERFTAGYGAPFAENPSYPAPQGRLGLVRSVLLNGPFVWAGFTWPEDTDFLDEAVKDMACSRAPSSKG